MRLIDLEAIRPNIRGEIQALDEVQREVLAETDPERRKALIERHRTRWTAVRDAFEQHSNGKCWYVECRSSGAHNDIDHYRPKSRVAEDLTHPGYYWLAFDWRNLRLSCQHANRLGRDLERGETGGKGDNFPLVNPEGRARGPEDDLTLEISAIVDPTNAADVAMLTFGRSGEVELVAERKGEPIAEAKLEASRLYLHLNWPRFRDDRVMLYNEIERSIHRGEDLAPRDFSGLHAVAQAFMDICKDLAKRTESDQEYSRAARAYVEMFQDRWWVRDIVLRVA